MSNQELGDPVTNTNELAEAICTWHQEVCERVQHEMGIPDDVVVEVKFQDGTSQDLTPEEKIVFIEGMRHVYDHFNTLPIQAVETTVEPTCYVCHKGFEKNPDGTNIAGFFRNENGYQPIHDSCVDDSTNAPI